MQPFLKYVLLWLLPLFLHANFVNWLGNYDVAHQKALKENKPLLVLVVKKNDPLSSEIIKNSFMNKKYVDLINQSMVPVIVTYEGVLSYPVEMYYTTVFPTLFFVNSEKELLYKRPLYGKEISKKHIAKYLIEIFN
jgi:hypothetical protein